MYESVKACVSANGECIKSFDCPIGLFHEINFYSLFYSIYLVMCIYFKLLLYTEHKKKHNTKFKIEIPEQPLDIFSHLFPHMKV